MAVLQRGVERGEIRADVNLEVAAQLIPFQFEEAA